MNYCLPKDDADKFKKALKSGALDPEKLVIMTSAERQRVFSNLLGEVNAGPVNALFESKLLLKNQQAGMIAWAKSVMGPKDPKVRQTIIDKVEKMKKALTPQTEESFLSDLVAQKLGMDVSYGEAQKIAELADKVKTTREDMESSPRRETLQDSTPTEEAYGNAVTDLRNYVYDLTLESNKLTIADFRMDPLKTSARAALIVPGMAKSIKASLDSSYLFRQGFKTLVNHPGIWRRNAIQSFRDMGTAWGSDRVLDQVNADIVSRPTYPQMLRAKLPLLIHEEAFPESLHEKVLLGIGGGEGDTATRRLLGSPFSALGRAFRASDHAFTAFNQRNRADIFDKMIQIAEHPPESKIRKALGMSQVEPTELDDQELQSIGRFASQMTSRGSLGRLEGSFADVTNKVFFSPRNMAAIVQTFTHTITGAGAGPFGTEGSSFVRKQALKSLIKQVAAVLGILLIAKTVLGKAGVDFDFRGSDAGKIKIKNNTYANIVAAMLADMMGISTNTYGGVTRYDVTAGTSSYLTLLARLLPLIVGAKAQTKSTTTGKLTPLNSGKYGSQTGMDVLDDFAMKKLAPIPAVGRDRLKGETYSHKEATLAQEAKEAFAPLVYTNLQELLDDQKNPHPPKPKK